MSVQWTDVEKNYLLLDVRFKTIKYNFIPCNKNTI